MSLLEKLSGSNFRDAREMARSFVLEIDATKFIAGLAAAMHLKAVDYLEFLDRKTACSPRAHRRMECVGCRPSDESPVVNFKRQDSANAVEESDSRLKKFVYQTVLVCAYWLKSLVVVLFGTSIISNRYNKTPLPFKISKTVCFN